MSLVDISQLQVLLREFAEQRGWVNYHSPKNLAMALAGEADELAAVLQWTTEQGSLDAVRGDGSLRGDFAGEMADVIIYLARMADIAELDLADAVAEKMAINRERFPS